MRTRLFALISVLIGIAGGLVLLEIPLRFLPVHEGMTAQPVDAANPIFRFAPNREVVWSGGWNFAIVNRVRVNNAGFVNDQDYDPADRRPLLAVVGDSYVEAGMVPYPETVQGRLAAQVGDRARVYSFAASGAPLSQYVSWAKWAREHWRASALAIVVVGNDFDESLAAYNAQPGFHHYVEDGGSLVLRRYDYRPGRLRELARKSALARYLIFNLGVLHHHNALRAFLAMPFATPARASPYVGNTAAAADAARLRDSEAGVRAFLRDLVEVAGWEPERVVFLVDGIRYPASDPAILDSYFVRMRGFFLAESRRAGFEAIDLDPMFFARPGERFEFPTDAHWNGNGHGVAATAVLGSAVYASFGRAAAAGQ
jgi:hypothetical protein